jgi:secondary thiamine-phosphate synthase enzyme
MHEIFRVDTKERQQALDVTDEVRRIVRRAGLRDGLCHVMVLHSTAALIVNENDDLNIAADLIQALSRAVPDHAGWRHDQVDDNAHAHIKASLLGPSELLAVRGGELVLGAWQRLLLLEFDGPRQRQVSVQLLTGAQAPGA